jgi:choline dehydrogenase-like flavoprotein
MDVADFAVVGSSGGGGTIAWLLASAGFKVFLAELGPDIAEHLDTENLQYNPLTHDENRFRLGRPTLHRRPRGDYNTFRSSDPAAKATPFNGAWTASVLGGGSVIWGTWSFRALPIDFRLGTHFAETGQLDTLKNWGYSVPDWPVSYGEMEPFYNVAETLLAVSGDRDAINQSVTRSGWYQAFQSLNHFKADGNYEPTFPFPCQHYPITPVGQFVSEGFKAAGKNPAPLPSGMVSPGSESYSTREAIGGALARWGQESLPSFWSRSVDQIWSDRVRDACNLCGFCGEFLCWGKRGPKSSSRVSTIRELQDLSNAEIRANAKVFEVMYDEGSKRATGIRYLDISDPDRPRVHEQRANHIVVAGGAVQSARLLLMSGPPEGLGNGNDQVGRYATFHLFGFGATCTLPEKMQGYLHSELGHTGNTMTFADYFALDDVSPPGSETLGKWWKAGTMVSTAKKNPLDNADGKLQGKGLIGRDLIADMERYNRSLEIRLTGDDLPMARNRVDLDPTYVDEYGFPVARITRDFGPNEMLMFTLMQRKLKESFQHYADIGLLANLDDPGQLAIAKSAILTLIGDHQMGTCRMGNDPKESVVDRFCRVHDAQNVFVLDSSIFPTGFGLNPMVTVMANALRVGTWIVEQSKSGEGLG